MENKGNNGSGSCSRGSFHRDRDDGSGNSSIRDFDREVTLSGDQIIVLEKLFEECPKPSLFRRLQWIHESALFSNLDCEQIKAWFEYRRMIQDLTLQIRSKNDIVDKQGNTANRDS